MSEPTPEAVEELARVIAGAVDYTIPGHHIARAVLAAGYVRDASVLVLREQVAKQGAMIGRAKEMADRWARDDGRTWISNLGDELRDELESGS